MIWVVYHKFYVLANAPTVDIFGIIYLSIIQNIYAYD